MKKGQINIGYAGRRIAFNGTEKLVGSAERYSTIDYAAIVAYAAKAAAVPESSIEMAMEAIYDALNYFVLNGHSVQIPNLGTFSIGVQCKTTATETEFTNQFSNNLRNVKIRFLPDPELKAMIANTAISTSVNLDNYADNGVIAVKSDFFGAGNTLVPANAGRSYAISKNGALTRYIISGTRLSASYIRSIYLTGIDANGEAVRSLIADTLYSQSYSAITINLRNYANAAGVKFLKKIEVQDIEGNEVFSKTFGDAVTAPYISGVSIDGKPIAESGTADFVADKLLKIKVYGANLAAAESITIGGIVVEPSAASADNLVFEYTPAATGNAPISVSDGEHAANVYNLSFGEAGGTVVTAVTANGDPLLNGSTTNITDGSNYNIAISGYGLAELTAANFVLPAGSSLNITSQSDTMIAATLSSAHAGDFKVKNADNEIIFAAGLVVVAPGVSVTGYKLTQSGATQSLGTAVQVSQIGDQISVYLVGEELDDLSTADFVGTNVSNLNYTPASGLLTGTLNAASGSIRITNDGTTIGTISCQVEEDDYNPIDTGN